MKIGFASDHRGYALKQQLMKELSKEYDVVDTVMNQVYLDEETLKERWKEKYIENNNNRNNDYYNWEDDFFCFRNGTQLFHLYFTFFFGS